MSGARSDAKELSAENAKKLPIYDFLGAFSSYFLRNGMREPTSKIIHYYAQLEKLASSLATDPTYQKLSETKEELLDLLKIHDETQVKNKADLGAAKEVAEKLREVIYENFKQNPPTFLSGDELKSLDHEKLDQDYKQFYPFFLCCLAAQEAASIRHAAKFRPEDYFVELLAACLPFIKLSDPASPRLIAEIKPANMLENQENFKNLISLLVNDEELRMYHQAKGYTPVEQLKQQSGLLSQSAAYMYKRIIPIIAQSGAVSLAEQEYFLHLFCRMAANMLREKRKLDSSPRSPKLGSAVPDLAPSSRMLGPTISKVTPGALISGSMWTQLNGLGSGIKKATGVMANLASQVGIPTLQRKR